MHGLKGSEDQQPVPAHVAPGVRVFVAFSLYVLARAVDRVLNKRVSDRMQNYITIYTNMIWPIGSLLVNTCLAIGWVVHHRWSGDLRYGTGFFSPRWSIASRAGAYSQWSLALFSLWGIPNVAPAHIRVPASALVFA